MPLASVSGPPRIEVLGLSDGQTIRPPFKVGFHCSGFNISDASIKTPETNHFRLVLDRPNKKSEPIEFHAGQTETWLNPPAGAYILRLELVSNVSGDRVASLATPLAFTVATNGAPSP